MRHCICAKKTFFYWGARPHAFLQAALLHFRLHRGAITRRPPGCPLKCGLSARCFCAGARHARPRPPVRGASAGRLRRAEKQARRLRRITASIPGANLVLNFEFLVLSWFLSKQPALRHLFCRSLSDFAKQNCIEATGLIGRGFDTLLTAFAALSRRPFPA